MANKFKDQKKIYFLFWIFSLVWSSVCCPNFIVLEFDVCQNSGSCRSDSLYGFIFYGLIFNYFM